jgi:hypothetical protein
MPLAGDTNTPLPLGAFCEDAEDAVAQWRRLTVLWQAYLGPDDWDRVLSSFELSDLERLELSGRDIRREVGGGIEGYVSDPHILEMIKAGRLTGDRRLSAASSVWTWVLAALMPGGQTGSASVEWLVASAFFRLAPGNTSAETVAHALKDLGTSDQQTLKLIVGGPARWPDEMLAAVASHVIGRGEVVDDIGALISVIGELGKRGSVALARKLLKLVPTDAVAQSIPPADTAALVSLSRRHQEVYAKPRSLLLIE